MDLAATKNPLILFQGDSITDAERNREEPWSLGTGYALMIAGWFQALFPEINGVFLNRGVGGDRVVDLKARWQEDCLDLKPDLVSIMIGINDCWGRYSYNTTVPVEEFEADYRAILRQTKEALAAEFDLCEPFVLPVMEARKSGMKTWAPKFKSSGIWHENLTLSSSLTMGSLPRRPPDKNRPTGYMTVSTPPKPGMR